MDIVTHGMMGVALAGPLMHTHPAEAGGFILGSALPDLDSLSRCFGKRAFLLWHQSWTHAFPIIAIVGICAFIATRALLPEASPAVIGLSLGAALHSLLDLTNTFGVRALAPWLRRRFCWEWMFFIDLGFVLLTVPATISAVIAILHPNLVANQIAIAYAVSVAAYVGARAILRHKANKPSLPNLVSIIPSALLPWEYFLCCRDQDHVRHYNRNLLSGKQSLISEQPIYDSLIRDRLEEIPEFRAMAVLSPAYHVVSFERGADSIRVRCRDLRIVNFNTTFGMLDVEFSPELKLISANLHV